jgi:solute carrier family 35 protein F5
MGITLSSDFIYVLAMLKTTPLVVTIGLSLTIPLAVLGDFLLGKPATGQVLFGATLVLFSFVAVGIQSSEPKPGDDLLNNVLQPPQDEARSGEEGHLEPIDGR